MIITKSTTLRNVAMIHVYMALGPTFFHLSFFEVDGWLFSTLSLTIFYHRKLPPMAHFYIIMYPTQQAVDLVTLIVLSIQSHFHAIKLPQ